MREDYRVERDFRIIIKNWKRLKHQQMFIIVWVFGQICKFWHDSTSKDGSHVKKRVGYKLKIKNSQNLKVACKLFAWETGPRYYTHYTCDLMKATEKYWSNLSVSANMAPNQENYFLNLLNVKINRNKKPAASWHENMRHDQLPTKCPRYIFLISILITSWNFKDLGVEISSIWTE